MPEDLLNLTEAGAITGLGRDTIRRRIDRGQLISVREGSRHFVTIEGLRAGGLLNSPQPPNDGLPAAAPSGESANIDVDVDVDDCFADPETSANDLDDDEPPPRRGPLWALVDGLREGWRQ